jgi:hypothetical protein
VSSLGTRTVAYHEAGHAVVGLLNGLAVERASIVPSASTGGHMLQATKVGDATSTAMLLMWLGAGAAERRLTGKPATLDVEDRRRARILASVITKSAPDSPAVEQHLKAYDTIADAVVLANWRWIERTAHALMRKQTISGGTIAGFM